MDVKSPFKAKPLRNPGESLDRKIDDIVYEDIVQYLLGACIFVLLALFEWLRWYRNAPPKPVLYSAIAIIVVAYAGVRVARGLRKLRRFKLGRDGEKIVGQFLERLRSEGAQVFHDIPGNGFNLDHLVIHRTGIYVVETKSLSKPAVGRAVITFDGDTVLRNGLEFDRNLITQVSSACKWLAELLRESTGHAFECRPVILYPGWYIESTETAKRSGVWVLNPKALPTFISRSAERLREEDVQLCAYHISRYIRMHKEEI